MIDRLELIELVGEYHLGRGIRDLRDGDYSGLANILYASHFFKLCESVEGVRETKKYLPKGISFEDLERGTELMGKDPFQYTKVYLDKLYERYGQLIEVGKELEAISRFYEEFTSLRLPR